MSGKSTPLYLALKKLAITLNEALAAKNLLPEIEEDGVEPCCWLRKETNPPPEAGKYLICYPVRGGSEGYWVHVDIIYRMGQLYDVGRTGVRFCETVETVMLAKTFTGFAVAAEIAKVVNERLDELEPMVIDVMDALGKV